jgi:hypothetical protein
LIWTQSTNVILGSFGFEGQEAPQGKFSKTQDLGSRHVKCKGLRTQKFSATAGGADASITVTRPDAGRVLPEANQCRSKEGEPGPPSPPLGNPRGFLPVQLARRRTSVWIAGYSAAACIGTTET